MVKRRRKYDKEFKLMAVDLMETDKSVREIAEDLDVKKDLLYQWRREFLKKGESGFTGKGNKHLTPQEAEIARLKKELREAELERDILKKAVNIFSKNDGKYSNS
jgi:transposase